MVFMAKWHRRAGVMTVAEWMEFRFGSGPGGQAARLTAAVSIVVLVLGMMTYFCVGFGKFLSMYFPFSPITCTVLFTAVAVLHILFSGLYGVAFTDVFQGFMILFVVVYIAVLAFSSHPGPEQAGAAWETLGASAMSWERFGDIAPRWTAEFPSAYAQYNGLGFLLIFWVLRMLLEGFGGPLIPYASQRFFAARDEREAALTTGSSLTLFVVRWPLIMGVAILGLSLGTAMPADPEQVFPAVLGAYFPLGMRAVVVSCMIAAAMSTFDSTVNAGGAYIVNDLYKRFIRPDASNRALMIVSWVSTVGLSVAAVLLSVLITSINEIWGWISMGLFGGMVVPFLLRWYWERFNGWGYAAGTLVGITAAIVQKAVVPGLSEAWQLLLIGAGSLLASVLVSLLTTPVDEDISGRFYRRTRPFGRWPRARAGLPGAFIQALRTETRRDLLSVALALVFFFCLFLWPMYFMIHEWGRMAVALCIDIGCAVGLYFSWVRHLGADDDALTGEEQP
jgi:Na+/proline symporter